MRKEQINLQKQEVDFSREYIDILNKLIQEKYDKIEVLENEIYNTNESLTNQKLYNERNKQHYEVREIDLENDIDKLKYLIILILILYPFLVEFIIQVIEKYL